PGPHRADVPDHELAPGRLLHRVRDRLAQEIQPEEQEKDAGQEDNARDTDDPPEGPHASRGGKLRALLGGLLQPFLHLAEPLLAPLERRFLRQYAARRIVRVPLAHALGAELRQDVVEALPAVVEGLGVGTVAEAEDAVAHLREAWALLLQVLVQRAGVVRDVALPVRGGADEEHALAAEDRAVEAVHEERLDLRVAVVQRELHLLRTQLRRAGHGADEDRDLEGHCPKTILHATMTVKHYTSRERTHLPPRRPGPGRRLPRPPRRARARAARRARNDAQGSRPGLGHFRALSRSARGRPRQHVGAAAAQSRPRHGRAGRAPGARGGRGA